MSVASSTAIISDMVDNIGDTIAGVVPEILTLAGILIGLMWGYRFLKRQFGRAK